MAGRTGRNSKSRKKPNRQGTVLNKGSLRSGRQTAKPYAANLAKKWKAPKKTYKTDSAPKTRKNPPAPSGHQSKRTKGFKPEKPPVKRVPKVTGSALDYVSKPDHVKQRQQKKTSRINTGKVLRSNALKSLIRRPGPAGIVTAAALTAASFIPPQKRKANPVSKLNRQRSYANMWSASETARRVNKANKTTTPAKPPKPKKTVKKRVSSSPTSFGAAFRAARKAHGGPGGSFTWKGKVFQTNVKGEAYVKNPKRVKGHYRTQRKK